MGILQKIRSFFNKKETQPEKDTSHRKGGVSSCASSEKKHKKVRSSESGVRSCDKSEKTAHSKKHRNGNEWSPSDSTHSKHTHQRNSQQKHSSKYPNTERHKTPRGRGEKTPNSELRTPNSRSAQSAEMLERLRKEREETRALHAQWDAASFTVEPEEGKKRFHDFDLPSEIMHAVADLGFKYCTPIQAGSLEKSMQGSNIAGRAQTGTGKTAAFLVSILTRYLRTPDKRHAEVATPRALVIAPTRELCIQIAQDAQALGKYCALRTMAVYGGVDYSRQQKELQDEVVDLLVATPGRLIDFARQHVVNLSKIDTLVIDEADRMLDMGFIPDVRRIIRMLPQERQTLLYSATLNDDVMRLASQWMPNPEKVEIEPEQTANTNIDQRIYIVTSEQKFVVLCNLLKEHKDQRVLVFGNRRSSTDVLAHRLRKKGHHCELLSGDVSQNERMRVLENFKSGKTKIVVATDVAGRGLHIADIGLVVNFELPYIAEDYVHRIGRTGRAGQVGTAVSFADEDESFAIPDIEEYLGETLKTTMLYDDDPLLAQ